VKWRDGRFYGCDGAGSVGEAIMTRASGSRTAAWWLAAVTALAAVQVAAGDATAGRQANRPALAPLPDDPRPWSEKVDPVVLREAVARGGSIACIVTFREPRELSRIAVTGSEGAARRAWIAGTAEQVEREYAPFGLRVERRFEFLPSVRMTVPSAFLAVLAADRRVEGVTAIRTVHALRTEGRALMNVPAVHAQGFTGAGVGIAILDTGVDYTHTELAPAGAKTVKLVDSINGDDDPMDDEGHGTSCAGIAGGAGGGVAPGATIVAVKVLDQTGNGTSEQVMEGIDAVLGSVNGGNPYNIRVASMSFGGYDPDAWPPGAGNCDAVSPDFVQAFQSLLDAGVLVVLAAGNGGCTTGVAWPGCVSSALVVGAVFDANIGFRSYSGLNCAGGSCSSSQTGPDTVACYSDSGERLDVWAPADCATTPTLGGGSEFCFTGTSAATPYVAGVAALLADAIPDVDVFDLRAALRATGADVTDPRNAVTRKRVDAGAALAHLGGACAAPAAPTALAADKAFACTGQSIGLTWDQVGGASSYTVQAATDASFAAAQSFTVTGTVFSYVPSLQTPELLHFRVRAAAPCGASSAYSSVIQVSFNPQCGSPFGKVYHVSGVGHLRGVAPAFWYSDLAVFNLGDAAAQMRLTFVGNASSPAPVDVALGAHQQITWRDVLTSLFGLTGEDVGAIKVESTLPAQVLARTYSRLTDACDSRQKTYGQSYDGIEPSDALAHGQVGYLVNLRSDSGFRTNVEFVNVGTVAANVEVRFMTNAGAAIGSPLSRGVTPNQRVAVTAALPSGSTAAFAEVRVLTPEARVIGFASVIDGASTDPTTIPMVVTGTAPGQ
jgi:subtilisin family serine protease